MLSRLYRLALISLFLGSFISLTQAQFPAVKLTEEQLHELKLQALKRINADRALENLPPVEFDELSSTVADAHCRDVVDRGVISHWSTDGRKPYMRYSWAGGRDGVAENVAYTQGSIETDAYVPLS